MKLFSINLGGGGSSSGAVWGAITGTLSDQLDLQAALNAKAPTDSPTFTTRTRHDYATATRMAYFDSNKDLSSVTAVTASRIMFADANGLPTFTGLGVSTAFGANDPIIFATGSLNFKVAGAAGPDSLGIGSDGTIYQSASLPITPSAAGVNSDLGRTGTRFRDLFLKGAVFITAGNNQVCGTATLAAGTITVNNTRVTANSLIFVQRVTPGGTVGNLSLGAISAGSNFIINSDSGTETSTVNWFFIN